MQLRVDTAEAVAEAVDAAEMTFVRDTLSAIDEAHWREYLAAWPLPAA